MTLSYEVTREIEIDRTLIQISKMLKKLMPFDWRILLLWPFLLWRCKILILSEILVMKYGRPRKCNKENIKNKQLIWLWLFGIGNVLIILTRSVIKHSYYFRKQSSLAILIRILLCVAMLTYGLFCILKSCLSPNQSYYFCSNFCSEIKLGLIIKRTTWFRLITMIIDAFATTSFFLFFELESSTEQKKWSFI